MMSGIPVCTTHSSNSDPPPHTPHIPYPRYAPTHAHTILYHQDFDTAKGRGDILVDPFRAALYKTPDMSPGPVQILSYPWVYTKKLNAYKGGLHTHTYIFVFI